MVSLRSNLRLGTRNGQEVETEVPRAAEAGLYTGGDKGRLCALVRAQLVRIYMHAPVSHHNLYTKRVQCQAWLDI
ncbi:hypothetical protein IEO21_10658 [Rhodonia placenta]|uniref:Uncharacterized protein n=1 Tax=Rhodonia placenta TaxID=104341 RepID=A0A8H7NS75_9APHY|nr:hypothetical protein IEO21_10658 [Postia placenta]